VARDQTPAGSKNAHKVDYYFLKPFNSPTITIRPSSVALKQVPYDDSIVLVFIPGGVEESDSPGLRHSAQLLKTFCSRRHLQFDLISFDEFIPSVVLMVEPLSKLITWRNAFHPVVEMSICPRDAAWPQAIYQNSKAVSWFCRDINSFDCNHRGKSSITTQSG